MKFRHFALLASTAFSMTSANILLHESQGDTQTCIIGGDEANADEYPFAISLSDFVGNFCGGSMIGPDVVLSAA